MKRAIKKMNKELDELYSKRDSLEDEIKLYWENNPNNLTDEDVELIKAQIHTMDAYACILGLRADKMEKLS